MPAARTSLRKSPRVILLMIAVVLSFIGCYYARLWLQPEARQSRTTHKPV